MADNQLLERTCRFLRPTLLSEKFGVLADRLNTDYMEMVGEDIPYKRLNFPTLEAFLRSIPNFCAVRRTGRKDMDGRDELLIVGVAGQATAHIQEMVANQKSKSKKRSKGGKKKYPKAGGGGKKIYESILPCKKSTSGRSAFGLPINYKSKSILTMRDTSVKQNPIPPKVVNSSQITLDYLPETIGGLVGYKTRVVHILEGRSHGLLLSQIEKMYGNQFKECLPPSWSSLLEQEGVLMIERRTAGSVATIGTSNKNIQSLDSGYSTQSKDEETENNSLLDNEKKDYRSYSDKKEDYLSDTTDTDDKEDHPSDIDDRNPSGLSSSSSGISSVDNNVLSQSSTDEVHDIESTVLSTPEKFSSVGRSVCIAKSQCKHLVPGTLPQAGDWLDLTVSHVISPSKLMCSYYFTGIALQNLIIQMTSVYNQLEHDKKLGTLDLVPGCVLAVQENNVWYRARVVRKINNSSITVILVDIGRQLLISSISRLQPLWSEFGYLPEQVVEVSLTGVEPRREGDWRRDAVDWLSQNVKDKDFVGLVHRVKGNTVEIVMFDTSDENNDIVINSELVGRGYAKYSEV